MDIASELAKGTGRSGVSVNLNLSCGREEVPRACRMVGCLVSGRKPPWWERVAG